MAGRITYAVPSAVERTLAASITHVSKKVVSALSKKMFKCIGGPRRRDASESMRGFHGKIKLVHWRLAGRYAFCYGNRIDFLIMSKSSVTDHWLDWVQMAKGMLAGAAQRVWLNSSAGDDNRLVLTRFRGPGKRVNTRQSFGNVIGRAPIPETEWTSHDVTWTGAVLIAFSAEQGPEANLLSRVSTPGGPRP